MATRRISSLATTGWNVYFVLTRLSDGKVFDWSDNSWKVLASATTPGVAMSSLVSWGSSVSMFAGDLNMTTVNNTTTPVDVAVTAFHRAGGSPAPATDTPITQGDPFTIVNGDIAVTTGPLGTGFQLDVTVDTTTTAGTTSHVKVQMLDVAGQLINLNTLDPSATCAVAVIRDGNFAQFSLTTGNFGAPNAQGWFEADKTNPNYTTDIGYTAIATVVTGGFTYYGLCNFNVWP